MPRTFATKIPTDNKLTEFKKDGLDIVHHPGFFNKDEADKLLDYLLNIEYDKESKVVLFGKTHAIPREQTAFGDSNTSYRFSGTEVAARPWEPELEQVRDKLKDSTKTPINFVLINHYADGTKYIGWHADDERDLKSPVILSLSFGAARDFQFRKKSDHTVKYGITLKHGDLLIMRGQTNNEYHHTLPKRLRVKNPRVNMTFRVMFTDDEKKIEIPKLKERKKEERKRKKLEKKEEETQKEDKIQKIEKEEIRDEEPQKEEKKEDIPPIKFYSTTGANGYLSNFYGQSNMKTYKLWMPKWADYMKISRNGTYEGDNRCMNIPTSEHAYQAQKFFTTRKSIQKTSELREQIYLAHKEYAQIILRAKSPFIAAQLGRQNDGSKTTIQIPPRFQKTMDGKVEATISDVVITYRKLGVQMRKDWDKVKIPIMYKIVSIKFTHNQRLQNKLLDTEDKLLIEHTNRDAFWGDGGDGNGKNKLGQVLMRVRKDILESALG